MLDLRTVLCPHIETTIEMPRLRQLVLDEYVKYGLHEFDLQASRNAAEADEEGGSSSKKKKNGHGGRRKVVRPEALQRRARTTGLGINRLQRRARTTGLGINRVVRRHPRRLS